MILKFATKQLSIITKENKASFKNIEITLSVKDEVIFLGNR